MEILKYVSFFLPPLIAILMYMYLRYNFNQWSFGMLFKSFFWGIVSIVLVLLAQVVADVLGYDRLTNLRRVLFYALVVTAFFAELGKFIILRGFIYGRKDFQTPLDGIIYAVMISMGFATMNNILYFINIADLKVSIPNALTAGPANAIFGVMMGFFLGLGKLRKIRYIDSLTGLAAAVFFHALYSFCLITKDHRLLLAFFIGATIVGISLCFTALRMHQDTIREQKR